MKEFKVSCLNSILYLFIFCLIAVITLALTGIVAFYTKSGLLFLGVLALAITVFVLTYRNMPYYIVSVGIGNDGMFIKEKDTSFLWKDIEWYRYLENEGQKASRLVLKQKDGKKVTLCFLKMSQFEKDRKELVSLVIKNLEPYGENSRNYYDSRVWVYIAQLMVVSYVVGPVLVFYSGVDVKRLIAPFFVYIGSTLPLIITIYNNQKRK